MVKKFFILTALFMTGVAISVHAAIPSGVTLGEFRFWSADMTSIAGSISEMDDYLIFHKLAGTSPYFACVDLPGFNKTTEIGTAYNIQVTDIGTGLLYKYQSTAKGTADDVLLWQQNILIKAYAPGTTIEAPTTPTTTPSSSGTVTESPGDLTANLNADIEAAQLDGTKCPSDSIVVTNVDGTTDKLYSKGLLKGVSCYRATRTLEEVLQIVRNIVTTLLLPVVGILFMIMLLIGGILYITSAGNEQRAERGKKVLTAAIIGLLIVTLSYTLIAIFTNIIGGGVA